MVKVIFKELGKGFVHLFYPRLCNGCNRVLHEDEDVLCVGCKLQLPETGYHDHKENDTGLRFAGRIPYQYATTFAYFTNDGLLQHLLHRLKYGSNKDVGIFLGKQFAYRLQQTSWIRSIDMIIPVPLHPKRELKRGYNQSMLIAKGMSKILEIPANDTILQRVKHTESQTKKTRTERLSNMEGAFKITDSTLLKDKHILLVDDVLTTGATIEACALVLLQSASTKVSIATIGIAV